MSGVRHSRACGEDLFDSLSGRDLSGDVPPDFDFEGFSNTDVGSDSAVPDRGVPFGSAAACLSLEESSRLPLLSFLVGSRCSP